MEDVFARVVKVAEDRHVKVTELPGKGGLRIEGVTAQMDGTWQQHGICFSEEAIEALTMILKEWQER